ncbi:MAG: fused MFS/spermidine synthase [Phycisphaeraceae bacterium]|nr:fused MFS/spermidine synthase [Phycisphaeraceae bacterium]
MIRVFGVAIFISAALLFLIQPMAAKLVLPILGGSPNVWNTAMMFFQTMLILGYLYSHILTRKLPLTAQFLVHGAVLACVVAALPIGLPDRLFSGMTPTGWLLATLTVIAGLPYFAAATTGPLLQSWFGATDDPRAKDPYFLYAASNAGSFVGLLCFPFLIEPTFALDGQGEVWTVGYCVLVVLVLLSGLMAIRRKRESQGPVPEIVAAAPVTWSKRFLWIALAAAPSSLSLGVTAAITMDVAAVPLLWIAPLSIYLLTFTLAFSNRFKVSSSATTTLAVIAVLAVLFNSMGDIKWPLLWIIGAHFAVLATCAYACHRRLYETRPDVSRLTEFYLLAAIGGALGGVFNAIIAPELFRSFFEYPLSIAACLVLIAPSAASLRQSRWKHALASGAAALFVVALGWVFAVKFATRDSKLVYGALITGTALLAALFPRGGGNYRVAGILLAAILVTDFAGINRKMTVFAGRSFFGVYTVLRDPRRVQIAHGSTLHGEQFVSPDLAEIPTSYYHPLGPLGDIFAVDRRGGRPMRIAGVGLGAGTIAAYAVPGDEITFFEIDPLVRRIAEDESMFTYISQARARGATVKIIIGDGRMGLATSDQEFDLIILDAFSSDSIPVHLLTVEAMQMYKKRLAPDGILAVHASNRYFDLGVMVLHTGGRADLPCVIREDLMKEPNAKRMRRDSTWLALSKSTDTLKLLLGRPEWFAAYLDPKQRVWTDSYSSIFDVPWR